MKFFPSVLLTTLVVSFANVVCAEDFTRFTSWSTKLVVVPTNPDSLVEFRCNAFKSVQSLSEGLKSINWSESEKTSQAIDFRKYVVVVISKPSTFGDQDKLKLSGLYSEGEKLFVHYNIEKVQNEGVVANSFGLVGYRPALLVQVPKPIYDRYNLVCRSSRL